ncbi:MAG: PhoPQ-activated protein PqaA family protein [Candidatus Bipolaricaulota bacterium]
MKGALLVMAVVLATGSGPAQPPTELFDYLDATQDQGKWEVLATQEMGSGRVTEVRLRSQVWRGIPWDHVLLLCEPASVIVEDVVVLYISGDQGRQDTLFGLTAATLAGLRVAILSGVPVQPLFGLREDALIAYTFERYLAEGDPDWPLLLPMVRSAHAAMEALEDLAPELWGTKLRGFVLTGASKRGWATYLTAATAPTKVLGMVPIVFDILNMPVQLLHQEESLGAISPMLKDYTARGLTAAFSSSPAGVYLSWLVDPYSYRYAYTMPKLVILGSNDPYWAVDAVNHYWPGLPDPKLLLVVPNAGHGLFDVFRVTGSLAAFSRAVARGVPLPALTSKVRSSAEGVVLTLSADRPAQEARLWVASSPSRDFRQTRWEERELPATSTGWDTVVSSPQTGYLAFFAELVFEVEGLRLYMTTPTRVLGP